MALQVWPDLVTRFLVSQKMLENGASSPDIEFTRYASCCTLSPPRVLVKGHLSVQAL